MLISIDKKGIEIVPIDKGGKVQFALIKMLKTLNLSFPCQLSQPPPPRRRCHVQANFALTFDAKQSNPYSLVRPSTHIFGVDLSGFRGHRPLYWHFIEGFAVVSSSPPILFSIVWCRSHMLMGFSYGHTVSIIGVFIFYFFSSISELCLLIWVGFSF